MSQNVQPGQPLNAFAGLALPQGFMTGDIRHLANSVPALTAIVEGQIDIEREASARRESCYICALFTLVTMALIVSLCVFLYVVDVITSPISTVIIYITQETIVIEEVTDQTRLR
ncbi:uncharacterized protein [Dermacentor albipictus]|uniref:uncharacterized protein n=1 Tax=Dermacentor albipictus TaxID=60249 RepID=UPI0038FBFB09